MGLLESNFNGIQHLGVPVTDLERSKRFYRSLGFEDVMSKTFTHNGGQGYASMMRRGQVVMELYQMPEEALAGIRGRQDGHIDHIAFDVEDIERAFAELTDAGFSIVEASPVFLDFWTKGCWYFTLWGPDGERLEFNQVL